MNDDNGVSRGPWTVLETREVYADPWLSVRKDDVIRPDGLPGTHSVVTIKPGVCVLAVCGDDVILTREFHYGVGRITIEAVSGGREVDEDPQQCAARELLEELGVSATDWQQLTTVDPFTASVVSPTVLFIASDLTFGKAQPEGTEQIELVRMPLAEAYSAVCDGRITHAPTCMLIQRRWIEVLSGGVND